MTEPHTDEDALPPGTELGDYVIDATLGRGGFAITYRGHHRQLTRQQVAIKEYFPETLARRSQQGQVRSVRAEYADGRAEFLNEGQQLAALDHPNVVRVVNFFEANGTAYLVMAYEQGQTLETHLRQGRSWEESRLRALALKLLDALRAVHAGGLLHRDINPSNLILREDGEPVLIDFGAARSDLAQRTRAVTSIVTDGYSPTEQYGSNPKAQGAWTDLYALGATLYQVATGQRPVSAPERTQVVGEGEPDPLPSAATLAQGRYSEQLLHWIDDLLSIHRGQRPQSADEALRALRAVARPKVPTAQQTRPVQENQRWGTAIPAPQVSAQANPDTPPKVEDERSHNLPQPTPASTTDVSPSHMPSGARGRYRIAIIGALIMLVAGAGALALTIGGKQPSPSPQVARQNDPPQPVQQTPVAVEPIRPVTTPTSASASGPEPSATALLFIATTPANARVRILNTGPAYRAGMKLEPGQYQIEVSAPGYQTRVESVQLDLGGLSHSVVLVKKVPAEPAPATAPTPTAVTGVASTTATKIDVNGFVDRRDGVLLDTKTGLEWTRRDNGSNINWHDAGRHCANLGLDGGGWRLPSMDELAGIYGRPGGGTTRCGSEYSSCKISLAFRLTSWVFWSTEKNGSSMAKLFNLSDGGRISETVSFSFSGISRALCVRRGS